VSRCSKKQTYPKSLYKVIVVDNGSDEVKSIVDKFGQAFTLMKIVLVPMLLVIKDFPC